MSEPIFHGPMFREALRPATPEEIHVACLAYNHGYGLMEDYQKQAICREAIAWRDAWAKVAQAGKDVNR